MPGRELYAPFLASPESAFVRHIAGLYPHLGPPGLLLEEKRRHFRRITAAMGEGYVFAGVREQLAGWRARGVPLAAASNGDREDFSHSLMIAELWDCLDALAGADEVASGKPEPDVYLLAARRLGVEASRCGAAEDSPLGVRAARRAGCLVAAVATRRPVDELEAALAEHPGSDGPGGAVFGDTASALAWLDKRLGC